jgi:hypothetical protein
MCPEFLRFMMAFGVAALMGLSTTCVLRAEDAAVGVERANQRTKFSDEDIRDGFFKIAFRGELELDRPGGRIRKFDEPVRIFIDDRSGGDVRIGAIREISAVIADIRAHVQHINVAVTTDRKGANFLVTLVQSRDFQQTIVAHYGPKIAAEIQRTLRPECLSGIGKDRHFRIRRAEVILPVDTEEFDFYDCAYEELLQGLGVINDDSSVPWTMFNDQVQKGFFDVYDQYLVNILYDPRVWPGMTKADVNKVIVEVLPTVRAWVAKTNQLKE